MEIETHRYHKRCNRSSNHVKTVNLRRDTMRKFCCHLFFFLAKNKKWWYFDSQSVIQQNEVEFSNMQWLHLRSMFCRRVNASKISRDKLFISNNVAGIKILSYFIIVKTRMLKKSSHLDRSNIVGRFYQGFFWNL